MYLLRPGRQGLRCVSSSNANLLQIFYGPSVSIDHCLMINECVCVCIWTVGAISVGGFCLWARSTPYRSPVPTQCVSVCEVAIDHCDSLVRVYLMMWGLFMKSWPTCGREGKKVRWGEIETAWGCDIKISSRWWMSTRATLARTTKRQLCNGRQVISRFVH